MITRAIRTHLGCAVIESESASLGSRVIAARLHIQHQVDADNLGCDITFFDHLDDDIPCSIVGFHRDVTRVDAEGFGDLVRRELSLPRRPEVHVRPSSSATNAGTDAESDASSTSVGAGADSAPTAA